MRSIAPVADHAFAFFADAHHDVFRPDCTTRRGTLVQRMTKPVSGMRHLRKQMRRPSSSGLLPYSVLVLGGIGAEGM
jgi:hypothetical protein